MGGAAGVLGDDATIRAAYVSHGGELYRFALRSLREPWLAEDAAPGGPPASRSRSRWCPPGWTPAPP